MRTTREQKHAEAVDRMRKIGMYAGAIQQFEDRGQVCESVPPLAACYWISDEQAARVREFEERYDALVYHIMRAKYEDIGEIETYMYICDDPAEWPIDRADLDYNSACCYANNLDNPDFSEFGAVDFKLGPAAGLLRTS